MVENPNRKVEKLLPEERLGGNGLFARITVFPGREIDYHEHHGETETYHIIAGEGVYGDNGAERAIYAETGSLTDRKKPAKSYDFADFLSYRNTIDFRTPDLKITVRETTLQSSLWLFCIISRFKLQNPMILCQHLHLADGNGVEFCQPFRLRYSFIDEHSIQIFQI